MGIVFYQNSFIGELFWHSRIYGYDFKKFLRIYGYTFEKFLRIYGWYFHDLNGTTPYLGNSSYPPPRGAVQLLLKGKRGQPQGGANVAKFSETFGGHCSKHWPLRSMGSSTVDSFFSWE